MFKIFAVVFAALAALAAASPKPSGVIATSYGIAAPLAYSAPLAAAPLAYSAGPLAYSAGPLAYSAPLTYSARFAAPLAYSAHVAAPLAATVW